MSSSILLQSGGGNCHLLLGNEAIVRGALEAGVASVSCYPGTPSSEVPDTFLKLSQQAGASGKSSFRIEYSINEKVAMEVGAGAALAGYLSLVTMKHVGMNVAADPIFTAAYSGLPGGLVVLSADDPGCHSSQNEQDNRYYARAIGMPCFEPSSPQEAKSMTVSAFELARRLEQPVMLRTTTRVSHSRGPVVFGELPAEQSVKPFTRNPGRFVAVPAVALRRHIALDEAMKMAREEAEKSNFNQERECSGSTVGVIASGICRNYLADALVEHGMDARVRVFELGMTWPLPEKKIAAFLQKCDKVLVLEEGADLLEHDIQAIANRTGCKAKIEGRDSQLEGHGEYSVPLITRRLASWLGISVAESVAFGHDRCEGIDGLPGRPPNLCPGCGHRAVYYAVRRVFGDEAVFSGDIGCYTLGAQPPLRAVDFLFCMGSSISAGSGFGAVSGKQVIGFIGDSTFFHSGMTGLANAVFNRHDILLIILDNGTTAMTGHQPNPGMLQSILGDVASHLDMESVVRGLGVTDCVKVRAYNLKAVTTALEEMKSKHGVRVIIAEEPCVLYARRQLHKSSHQVAYVVQQGDAAEQCLKNLACPAFYRKGSDLFVDDTLCSGCMVCLQVAPGVFKAKKLEG